MTNAYEKKETYGGFNEALAQFMAEPGPAELLYYPHLDTCFTKKIEDLRNVRGENSEFSGFMVLATKGVA